jgi:hypothetical protein
MGLAAQLNHPLPVYKPSRLGGLVVLTSTRRVGLSEVDALSSGERRSVSALGLNLLRGWARFLDSQPLAYAELQASLRAQDRLLNIDRIQQAVGLVTQSNVLSKVASFGKEEAIVVEGRK